MEDDWRDTSVLIVGAGSIGSRHFSILQELGVSRLAACDNDSAKLEVLREALGTDELYPTLSEALQHDFGAVFICTPPALHIGQAHAAIEAGCDVFCEKPLSDSPEGIDELSRLVQDRGKLLMVGLCLRFHEGLRLAKQRLDEGAIGRLVAVRAMVGEYLPEIRPDFQTLFTTQTTGAFDLMHEVDLAVWYANGPPRWVTAMTGNHSDVPMKAPDLAEILVEFNGGVIGSIHLDFFQRARRRITELLGTEGSILVEFASWEHCTVSVYTAHDRTWTHRTIPIERDDMFRTEDQAFLECVARRTPVPVDAQTAKHSVAIVHGACQAAQQGHTVEL